MALKLNKNDKLTDIIKRLNSGEDPQVVKHEAQEFIATVDPAELSNAEQKLIEAGLKPEDLMHLCSVHMDMIGDELQSLRNALNPGNVIHTLVCEHDMILGYLDTLENTNRAVQKMTEYSEESEEFAVLDHSADHLLGAEPHHQREEEILFPELEKHGVYGPPQVMRREHEKLRARKATLKELSGHAGMMDFEEFKKKLDVTVNFIVPSLRDHIFKENNILYPAALQVITDDALWEKLKEACDEIGYCCFTPTDR